MHCSKISELLARFPTKGTYDYGTSGFRMKANLMPAVAFRVGLFVAGQVEGNVLGVMITASHNPVEDNGIKLVGPSGEMMEDIEEEVTRVCNMSHDKLIGWFEKQPFKKGCVLVGRDTRPSGPDLLQALTLGISLFANVSVVNVGLLTTPQLHYYTMYYNKHTEANLQDAESAYYSMLSSAETGKVDLYVDCANGIGAIAMSKLNISGLNIRLVNTGDGQLNHECGADYVKSGQRPPSNILPSKDAHYASLDGDADRVVFFRFDEEDRFHLLDGDRMAVLVAERFIELMKEYSIEGVVGVVQTAYANGSSTNYLRLKGIKTVMTCTGVKNLHREAKQFDVGVYFEANGHGTILFSDEFRQKAVHVPELRQLMSVVNQCVGDALSDLLLIEVILSMRGMSLCQWEASYEELPSVMLKVTVPDRSAISTTNADQTVARPSGLQAKIDEIVAKFEEGRSFVRPSGTEDVVRIYAEAKTAEQASDLAKHIQSLVTRVFNSLSK